MRRLIVLGAALIGAIGIFGVQPVKADVQDSSSLSGWVTKTGNEVLGDVPMPNGLQPRHVCMGVDSVNWGECITVPFPS